MSSPSTASGPTAVVSDVRERASLQGMELKKAGLWSALRPFPCAGKSTTL